MTSLSDFRERLFSALERRSTLFPNMNPTELIRLCHEEAPPLRWDKMGTVHWLGWWSDNRPTPQQLQVLEEALLSVGAESWALEWRKNREKNKTPEILAEQNIPLTWTATERGQKYLLKSNQGQSRGVFLDQREQRSWVKENSADLRVLNLFAYTCGFSVAAALGGAKQVDSVDVSKAYLNWGKENFELNQLPSDRHKFFAWDSLEFLDYAAKKKFQYDLIVCDPPSFGRSGKNVFQITKDWSQLLRGALGALAPGGTLLFTTNYEGWHRQDIQELLGSLGLDLRIDTGAVRAGEDFASESPILKGALITRRQTIPL